MVTSEAALLKASSPALRSLFLARLAEKQLLSLEMGDFVEERAVVEPPPPPDSSHRKKRRNKKRPSGRGGPVSEQSMKRKNERTKEREREREREREKAGTHAPVVLHAAVFMPQLIPFHPKPSHSIPSHPILLTHVRC